MRRLPHWMLAAAALLFALNVLVFGARAGSLFRSYRLIGAEGAEAPNPYAIWRLLHGYTLYESPSLPRFSLTLYNFGFYRTYAAVLGILGVDGEQILLGARLLSVALAGLGAFCYWRLILELLGPLRSRGSVQAFTAAMSLVVWLGTNFAGWWPLAIRPDVGAWLFATLGLWSFVRWLRIPNTSSLILSSLLFFCAWSFKQSAILTFAGVLGWTLLVLRRPGALIAVAAPFALLVGSSLALGSAAYRFDILRFPTLSAWNANAMVAIFLRGFLQNLFIWTFPIYFIVSELKSRSPGPAGSESRPHRWWQRLTPTNSLLAFSGTLAIAAGTFALGREGSNKNHVMEGYLLAGLLACKGAVELVFAAPPLARAARPGVVALLSLAPMLAFPVGQLILPNRFGVTCLLSSDAEKLRRSDLSELVAGLPKPLFIEDEVFSLPWNSTNNRYPAVVLDRSAYTIARRHGLIFGGGIEGMIRDGFFASVVLPAEDPRVTEFALQRYACSAAPKLADLTACVRR